MIIISEGRFKGTCMLVRKKITTLLKTSSHTRVTSSKSALQLGVHLGGVSKFDSVEAAKEIELG